MNHNESLTSLEATVGQELGRALPRPKTPANVSARIREQVDAAVRSGATGTVLPFPRRQGRPWLRWAGAIAAAVLIALSGVGSGLFGHFGGENEAVDLDGPWFFGPSALAGSGEIPSELTGTVNEVSFRLDTALPALPERAPVYTLTFGEGGIHGSSFYKMELTPDHLPGQPAIGRTAAEELAAAWLKERGLYPEGPLEVLTFISQDEPQYASVHFFPGPGHEFYSMNEHPRIWLGLNGETVFAMERSWPEAMKGSMTAGLKTAAEAWADLQANNEVWIGGASDEEPLDLPPNPVLTVKRVELNRAWARSADDRFYLIPVAVFHSNVTDIQGRVREVYALVSAIRPE